MGLRAMPPGGVGMAVPKHIGRFVRQLGLDEAKSRVPRTFLNDDTDDNSSNDDDTDPSPLVNGTATDDSSDPEVPEASDIDNNTDADAASSDAEVPEPRVNNAAIANLPEPRTPVNDTSTGGSRGVEVPARRDSKHAGPNFLAPCDTSAPELGDNTSPRDKHLEPSDIVVNDIPLQRVADKTGVQLDDPSDIDGDTARVFGGLVAQLATSHIHTIKQSADLVAPVITTEQVVVQANLIDNNDRIIDELATATVAISSEQAAAPVSIADGNKSIDEVPLVNPDSDERADKAAPNSAGAPHDELSSSSKQPAEQVSADGATEEAADISIVVKTEQPKKTSTADGTTAPALLTAKASHNAGASRSGNKVDADAAKKASVEMASARGSNRPTSESFVNNLGKESSSESDSNHRSTVDSALDSIIVEGSTIPTVPRSNNSVPAGGDTGMQVDTLSISAGVRHEEPSISAGSQPGETSATDAVMQDATIVSNTGVLRVMEQPPADVEMEAANPPIVEVDMEERPPVADLDMADAERPADDDLEMEDEDTASDNNVQMGVYEPVLNAASVQAQMEVLKRPDRQPRARRPANAAAPSLPVNTFRFEANPLPPTPVYPVAGTFNAGSFNFGNAGNRQFGGNPGAQHSQPNTDADDDGSSDDDEFNDLVNNIEASLEDDARNPANDSGAGDNAQVDKAKTDNTLVDSKQADNAQTDSKQADKAKVDNALVNSNQDYSDQSDDEQGDSEQIDYDKVDSVARLYTSLSYIERQWLLDQAMSENQAPTAIGDGASFGRESVSAEEVLKLYNSLSDEERLEFICRAPEEK
ncbi:hypothetical protein GGI17_004756 [Coemansia sp. S146]|nr:hypothetical protein GGI17_004756 [Coemansia sp. S146]